MNFLNIIICNLFRYSLMAVIAFMMSAMATIIFGSFLFVGFFKLAAYLFLVALAAEMVRCVFDI